MPKLQTTPAIDATLLRAVRRRATDAGVTESEVVEEALRRELAGALPSSNLTPDSLGEDEAMELALEAQHAARRHMR